MAGPDVPIEVDPKTGIWSTDGLAMIYLPRHFFVNNHKAIEAALGREVYARQLFEAGRESARVWCATEARTHGLAGAGVFDHYMHRLSQRGWGRFRVLDLDAARGVARLRLDDSVFVHEYGPDAGRNVCYMFAGWFVGALEWVGRDQGRALVLSAREVACASNGAAHCRFEVGPA